MMEIDKLVVGSLFENTYIISKNNKFLIIDPGEDIDKIKKYIDGKEIACVLITHRHHDHIGAISLFDEKIIYSYDNLKEKEYNIDGFKFQVIYTKGHSDDSISFYFKELNSLFCGDFIFFEDIGRCDLPTGDFNEMKKSICKVKKYPLDMIIYPGHGESTSLKHEIQNNIYF